MMVYEEIELIKPSLGLKDKALEYRQEHFDFGEQIINGSELFDKITSYEEWFKKVIADIQVLYPSILNLALQAVFLHIPSFIPPFYKFYFFKP